MSFLGFGLWSTLAGVCHFMQVKLFQCDRASLVDIQSDRDLLMFALGS
jgi:hypothetical protein